MYFNNIGTRGGTFSKLSKRINLRRYRRRIYKVKMVHIMNDHFEFIKGYIGQMIEMRMMINWSEEVTKI